MTAKAIRKRATIRCEVRGELDSTLKRLREWKGPREVLEVLVEGPRGTGKSRGVDTFLHWIAMKYPGAKILVVRKTRQSLTESFCKTFEEDVLGPVARRVIVGDADRGNRSHYQYPNGSRIALVGLDRPSKHQSTDWDVIDLEEASELTWRQVMPFFGALRNFVRGIPWQLMLAPTNPDAPRHWLNVRANSGQMIRVRTTHRDNPKWFDKQGNETVEGHAFLKSLERYTGVERDRHVLGLWRGAEGMVWENFDEKLHVIDEPEWRTSLKVVEYRGSMDWGTTHPGCFQVWGIDSAKRMTLVATIQRTGQTPDWWSQQIVQLVNEFQIQRIVADPSQPGFMLQVNDWLAARGANRIVYPANNKKASTGAGDMGGLSLVRWGFERDKHGTPRIRMLRNALRGPADPNLIAESKPTWVAEEIPGYVHARDATGEFMYETTDKDLPDDGCFVAGTPVLMGNESWRPIEDVRAGECVWTPNGPERVSASGSTGLNPTVIVDLGELSIRCTPGHPFHVVGSGMTRADMLQSGCEVSGWASTADERLASTTGSFGADTPTARTGDTDTSLAMVFGFTDSSTSALSGRSQRASTFTTGTANGRTIAPRISSRSIRSGTASNIAPIPRVSSSGGRRSASMRNADEPAINAALHFDRRLKAGPGSAGTTASPRGGEQPAWTTCSGIVPSVARFTREAVTLPAGLARLRVVGVWRADPAETFNLTVEPTHVYVAGGALVSNCDAMRYAATDNWGLSPIAPPLPPDPPPAPWTNAWQFGTPKSLDLARIRRENGEDD